MSWGPSPGGRGIPVRSTKTIKKITPSETSITTITTTRTGGPRPETGAIPRIPSTAGLGPRPAPAGVSRFGFAPPPGVTTFRGEQQPTKTLYAGPLRMAESGAIPRAAGASRLRQPTAPLPLPGLRPPSAGGVRMQTTNVNVDGRTMMSSTKTGTIPRPTISKPRVLQSTSSTTITQAGGRTVKKSFTTKAVEQPAGLPAGKYHIPLQHAPRTKEGRHMRFSSPMELRQTMEDARGKGVPNVMILPQRNEMQEYRKMLRFPGLQDLEAGNLVIGGRSMSPRAPRDVDPFLEQRLSASMIPDDWGTPSRGNLSQLEMQVERQLLEAAAKSPDKSLKATGTRRILTGPPQIITDHGPVPATAEVSSSKTVIRSPGQPEIIGRHLVGIEVSSPGQAMMTELEVQKLSPHSRDRTPVKSREVVQVTSSVSTGPGIKQTVKTVSYETALQDLQGQAQGEGQQAPMPNAMELSMMVEEESADIERTIGLPVPDLKAYRPVTYPIRKNVELLQLNPDSVTILEQHLVHTTPTADEEREEPQPEIIAAILNTEERGLKMDEPPSNIYNYLFADVRLEPSADVSSAAPAPLQDVVVPMKVPDQIKENSNDPNVLQATIRVEARAVESVTDCAYTANVGLEPIKTKNAAKKGKRKKKTTIPVLAKELPPWAIQDLEPVIDLVGGPPAGTMLGLKEGTSTETLDPAVDGIEYMLHMEVPRHSSRVQLRGSQNPSWFPGYMLALPDIPNLVTVAKSPSAVLMAAWKATQPDIFNEQSMFIV